MELSLNLSIGLKKIREYEFAFKGKWLGNLSPVSSGIWIYICFFFVIWFAFGCFFVLRVTHFIYIYHVIFYHSNCLVKRYVCENRLFRGCWTWKTFDWNWVGCECLRSRLSRLWPNIVRKRSEAVAKSVPLAFKDPLVDHAAFLLPLSVHHHQAISTFPHPFGLNIIHSHNFAQLLLH